jgi:hypothetical protein
MFKNIIKRGTGRSTGAVHYVQFDLPMHAPAGVSVYDSQSYIKKSACC